MAKKYFVTRHRGAVTWAAESGVKARKVEMENFDPEAVQPGDIVMGTLPVHVVAQVNAKGGHYWHLSMEVPIAFRGKELSADSMREFGARLEEFRVQGMGVRVSGEPEHAIVQAHSAHTHICIATGQTLPNLLSIAALEWEQVVVFASRNMDKQARHLAWLADFVRDSRGFAGPKCRVIEMPINLDWESLKVFAGKQVAQLSADGLIDFNITGGSKLMSMAFADAFRSQARLVYCATQADAIEVIDFVHQESISLPAALLDLDIYLAAQGFAATRQVSLAGGSTFKKVRAREALTATIVLKSDMLSRAKFVGEGLLGAKASSLRSLRFKTSNLLGLLHGLGSESAETKRPSGEITKSFESHVFVKMVHDNAIHRSVIAALERNGLIKNVEFLSRNENEAMDVKFQFANQDAAKYVGGGYLEEYVWLCMSALDIPAGQFAGNVGVAARDFSDGTQSDELNEMDAVAVWRNRLLAIECKAGVQLSNGKDQDILNKLDQLKDNLGGAMGKAWLVSSRPVTSPVVKKRAELNNISIVHGEKAVKGLTTKLATELGCSIKAPWPSPDLIERWVAG